MSALDRGASSNGRAIGCEKMADHIKLRLTWSGKTNPELSAFAGTCASFIPSAPGPVPAVLEFVDAEQQEWREMANELLEEVQELTGINQPLHS